MLPAEKQQRQAMSLHILVEYCTRDRSEKGSFTLRGDESSYLDLFKQLTTVVNLRLPHASMEGNTEELLQAIQAADSAIEIQRNNPSLPRSSCARMPRLGSFEVYLKMEVVVSEGTGVCRAERLKLVSSKIHSKRWPKVNRIVDRIVGAIEGETQEMVLRSLDSCRTFHANQIFHSCLGVAPRPRGVPGCVRCRPKECRCAIGAFGETWQFAGWRELNFLPTEFVRVGEWELVLGTLCNLHFIAAKIRVGGLETVMEDLDLALAVSGQPQRKSFDATKPHDYTAQPSRQVAYEIRACAQFLERNCSILAQKPSQIYRLASRMPLPCLNRLRNNFLGGVTDLYNLSNKIDVEDRDCTPEELMKFICGLSTMSWAKEVGFLVVFSKVEQRWLADVEMSFTARLVLQQAECMYMLRQDGRKCRTLLEIVRNGTMRDLSAQCRFTLFSQLLSEQTTVKKQRVKLVTDAGSELTSDHGHKVVDSVLKEFCASRNASNVSVEADKDQAQLRLLHDGSSAYFVTVVFSSRPAYAVATEKLFGAFLDALGDDELASMLPNRTALTPAGSAHDVDLLILLRPPHSLSLDEEERTHGVLADIRASSSSDLQEEEALSVVLASTSQLVVRLHADLLPPHTSPESVATELVEQLQDHASPLVSDDRAVLHHCVWIGHCKAGSPHRTPGSFPTLHLQVSGVPDPADHGQTRRFCEFVLPSLHTLCSTQSVILSLSSGGPASPAPSQLRVTLLPDASITTAGSPLSFVVAELAPPHALSQASSDAGPGLSAIQRKKMEDAMGWEAEAAAAYTKLKHAILDMYPTVTSPLALPRHIQEGQLQARCLNTLSGETAILGHPAVSEAVDVICRESTSTDISAPSVVMLHGASAHVRAVAMSAVATRLLGATRCGRRSFVSHFFKPLGMPLHRVLSFLTCDLWAQLLGGRHLRLRGEQRTCSMAELCDAVHRAADSTVDPIDKNYLRVVLVIDHLTLEEQLTVAEGVLSRPRLFPILSCVLSAELAAASGQASSDTARRARMVSKHMHTRILPLPPVPDACSPDGTEAARRSGFSAVMDAIDDVMGDAPIQQLMCQLITLPGLDETELRMLLASSRTPLLSSRLDQVIQRLRPYAELYPLLRHSSFVLTQDCAAEAMKRYLVLYTEGFTPESLKSLAQNVSSRQASPYIDSMLVPTPGPADPCSAEQPSVEQVGQYWGGLEVASFSADQKRYKDWVVAQHRTRKLPQPPSARLAAERRAWEQSQTLRAEGVHGGGAPDVAPFDKEIDNVLRVSDMAFSSQSPQPGAAPIRPYSAEPRRAHSRMEEDRHRPRTAASFRYRDDDVHGEEDQTVAEEDLAAPETTQDQMSGRHGSDSDSTEGLRGRFHGGSPGPDKPRATNGTDLWAVSERRDRGWPRYHGVDDAGLGMRSTSTTPDRRELVQPYMQRWEDPHHPPRLAKDWVLQDGAMRRKKTLSKTPQPSRTPHRQGADEEVPASRRDTTGSTLLSDLSMGRPSQSRGGDTDSRELDSLWSALEACDDNGPQHSETSPSAFNAEYGRAVARAETQRRRTDAVLAMLHEETTRRMAQREHKARLLTHAWSLRKESASAQRETQRKRQESHERFLESERAQRQDRQDFRSHVRESAVRWDAEAEAERREMEKTLREAVASRPAFDAYALEMELERERAAKKRERSQRQLKGALVEADPAQAEQERERKRRHEEMLVEKFGMRLSAEQCGAVTQLRGFGVRILREDQPATIMIGARRLPVKRHRSLRGRTVRDEQTGEEDRIGETTVREHFVMQIIPTGKLERGTDCFVGGYRLRVRYSNLKEKKVRAADGSGSTIVYEGVARVRPIRVLVRGSDGYQAMWTEEPTEGGASFAGVFETGIVVSAEHDVRDFVEIEGYFPAARESEAVWRAVKDVIEVEFLRS